MDGLTEEERASITKDIEAICEKYDIDIGVSSRIELIKRTKNEPTGTEQPTSEATEEAN
jgi:hypothetical protein